MFRVVLGHALQLVALGLFLLLLKSEEGGATHVEKSMRELLLLLACFIIGSGCAIVCKC